MGPRVFHAKFQPDRPKGVGLTTSGGQQLLGEQLILQDLGAEIVPIENQILDTSRSNFQIFTTYDGES